MEWSLTIFARSLRDDVMVFLVSNHAHGDDDFEDQAATLLGASLTGYGPTVAEVPAAVGHKVA